MTLGFTCPNCGEGTAFSDDTKKDDVMNSIYECGGCGENVLINGERDEPPAENDRETEGK